MARRSFAIRPSTHALALLAVLTASAAGCGTMTALVSKDGMAVMQEPASLEVCLDRVKDVDASLQMVNQLLFETPISADSAWVDALANVSQPVAEGVTASARMTGTYANAQRRVMGIKVYRQHTAQVLAAAHAAAAAAATAEAQPGQPAYPSVIAALGAIGGAPGGELATMLTESRDLMTESKLHIASIAALEAESSREGTMDARRDAISQEITAIEGKLEALEARRETLSERFDQGIAGFASVVIDRDKIALAKKVGTVLAHTARIELNAATALAAVVVQVPLALPSVHQELQALAMRWVNDAMGAAGGFRAEDIRLDIMTMSISIDGLANDRLEALTSEVTTFYDDVTGLPSTASSIADSIDLQAEMLMALAEAGAAMVGGAFSEDAGFRLE